MSNRDVPFVRRERNVHGKNGTRPLNASSAFIRSLTVAVLYRARQQAVPARGTVAVLYRARQQAVPARGTVAVLYRARQQAVSPCPLVFHYTLLASTPSRN